jgi:AcrR family transcriptional regulator
MGIREEKKFKTRALIIEETKNVLLEKGYIRLSTKDISNRTKVSQGTIFLHFQSKDNLLNYILIELISDFIKSLKNEINVKSKREDFVGDILKIISIHEKVLTIVFRDYSYLSDDIKKNVDLCESTLKSLFFDNIRNSEGKQISIVDSFVLIDGFLSQIKNYLLMKDLSSHGNIIKQSTGKLNKLYKYLFL